MAELLRTHGHDVRTVPEEQLRAATDEDLIQVCARSDDAWCRWTSISGIPCYLQPTEYAGIAVRAARKPPLVISGNSRNADKRPVARRPYGKLGSSKKGEFGFIKTQSTD